MVSKTTTAEVIEDSGYSYSRISRFAEVGRNEPKPFERSYASELGKYFEGVFRDKYNSSYDIREHYYDAGDIPERVINCILNQEPLDGIVRLKKDGKPYSTDVDLDKHIKKYRAHQPVFPINGDDVVMCQNLFKNACELEVMGLPLSDYLDCAEFDVGLIWENASGIRKKTQIDILSEVEIDGMKCVVVLDLKLVASQTQLNQQWRNYLWIQDRHISEGVQLYADSIGAECVPFPVFIVGYKDVELVQEVTVDLDDKHVQKCVDRYDNLVYDYDSWVKEGKKVTGKLEKRTMRIW